ncbi:MAG: hypothetical protein LKI24_17425 [Acidipropionibacterium sp.]|jgi:hypothetical protein|nr:hypothetical protein [Acidipropionibacterium sp.]
MSSPAPATSSTRPIAIRIRPTRLVGSGATGDSAATGGTRVARRAGGRAARTVTRIPTPIGTRTETGVRETVELSGRFVLDPPMVTSSWDSPIPAARPSTEPIAPVARASASTERRTWARVAPTQRASARVRVRWATRMAKVLTMTIAATAIAMAAKAAMNPVRKPVPDSA